MKQGGVSPALLIDRQVERSSSSASWFGLLRTGVEAVYHHHTAATSSMTPASHQNQVTALRTRPKRSTRLVNNRLTSAAIIPNPAKIMQGLELSAKGPIRRLQ